MALEGPADQEEVGETSILESLLPLESARILELGCGRAEAIRAIASRHPDARITAMEVDRIQHEINLAQRDVPNIQFVEGGAQAIPVLDASFDIVLMLKSLHHVPGELLDRAIAEIRRVLVPGGLAYISEPVFAGAYNDIVRIFHDEKRVRDGAFAAVKHAVVGGRFELVCERFFLAPVKFASFDDFERRVIGVTHTRHCLSEDQWARTREAFDAHLGADGAHFRQPMRVDLLRKPVV
ncbi:MAG TPA: class I SAM-dependent methyltransferase [Casimicrobiaceae bacterium]|nr:class I SAM-dependent methyltransferase [Casimicrobiaceae bacterium]